MPKFLIERYIPEAGKFTAEQLQAISQQSCSVLKDMGSSIQWVHSTVAGDKIYCTYIADDPGQVREHAVQAGFPANVVVQISAVIDPTTAETTPAG